MGFIDGAWKKDVAGQVKAGIGGFLLSKSNSLVFIFSGPSTQSTPYDTELEALVYLMGEIARSEFREAQIAILTDSKSLVNNMYRYRSEVTEVAASSQVNKLFQSINLVHAERVFNSAADSLAKQGTNRQRIISSWL